jgi:hypothetical protein
MRADSIGDADTTIMLFESDRGWNATGGAELLPNKPRHDGGDRYALADGQTHWIMRKGWDAQGRRHWEKAPKGDWVIWKPVLKQASKKQPGSMPPKLADLALGHDTIEEAERRYGPGLVVAGGHPQSARIWRSRQTGWYLYVDGFYYGKGGAVIDQITVSRTTGYDEEKASKPLTSLDAEKSSLFGSIRLGMSEAQVLSIAKSQGVTPKLAGNVLKWSEKGYKTAVYHTWTAQLDFNTHKMLDVITVGCE